MSNKQLFLIGTGRSGTTLIQRVFNTFPDTMIWGEHAGFLKQLSELYYFLKENSSLTEFSYSKYVSEDKRFELSSYNNASDWQAWVNWFRPDDMDEVFREIVEKFFLPEKIREISIWGFKEIRYGADDRVIPFLAELYPDACFVYITRDGLNTIESQLTNFFRGKSKFLRLKRIFMLPRIIKIARSWSRQNSEFLKIAVSNPERHYLIRYEDVSDDLTLLNPVLKKYGLEIGEAQLNVLALKEGRGSNFKHDKTVHERWRRMGVIPAFCAELIVGDVSERIGYARPAILKVATILSKLKGHA